MKDAYQQYTDNLEAVSALCKPPISTGLSQGQLLSLIRNDAQEIHRLRQENDRLLDRILFSRRSEELTDQEIQRLEDLAAKLSNVAFGLDMGIAYRIHQLLYRCALARNDRELTIRELYHQGLCAYYLSMSSSSLGINLLVDKVGEYFDAGAAYMDQYEDLPHGETRGYVIRCLANRRLGPAVKGPHRPLSPSNERRYPKYRRFFQAAMDVITSPRYREMDPELPWDSYEYALHFDRTSYLAALRRRPDQPELARDVLESAQFAYKYQSRARQLKGRTAYARVQYVYDAARFHAGLISAQELVDILFTAYDQADPRDFSVQGIFNNFRLPLYIDAYTQFTSPQEREALTPQLERCAQSMIRYLASFPHNEYTSLVSGYLADTSSYYLENMQSIQEHLLHFILACHPPTYVHCQMVAWIAQQFFAYMVESAPDLLEGAFGVHGQEEIHRRGEALCRQAYLCGLYHDAGKSMTLDAVGIYGRRLLDEEFEKIKLHPLLGFHLLKNYPDMDVPAQVALRHHRSWNEAGGYPQSCPPCPPEARLVLDVVTVADSMDAATDNVGRSYADAKSFQALVEELRRGSGTRYAPHVVALLDDPHLYQDLSERLVAERQRIYCGIAREQTQKRPGGGTEAQ